MATISTRLKDAVRSHRDWYTDPEFLELYTAYFLRGDGTELPEYNQDTWDVINWFAVALATNEVALQPVKKGFNDDDREGRFAGASPVKTDAVIVHETLTAEDLSIWQLEAVGLLRLYVPHFLAYFVNRESNPFVEFMLDAHPNLKDMASNNEPIGIGSGHLVDRDGKEVQSFSGYHVLIYPDGHRVQLLDYDMMGFHAGNLSVNRRGLGAAFVGNFSKKPPTPEALRSFDEWLKELGDQQIEISFLDSHTHVKVGHTECPGPWFVAFRRRYAQYEKLPQPKRKTFAYESPETGQIFYLCQVGHDKDTAKSYIFMQNKDNLPANLTQVDIPDNYELSILENGRPILKEKTSKSD